MKSRNIAAVGRVEKEGKMVFAVASGAGALMWVCASVAGLWLCTGMACAAEIEATPDNIAQVLEDARAGDTVLMADGVYKGGLGLARSGTENRPITIRAAGDAAVVDGGRDCLTLDGVSWVTVEGIRFQNAERAGVYVRRRGMPEAPGPAGEEHPEPAEHITIRNCVCANNRVWGIITSHIEHFTVEGCETFGATVEHGIYVANSGDDPIIRNNIVHHNVGNGIHINGDPDCGGDGIISRALVEGNVIYENGTRGGSAMSVMHVQDSIFRNNLLYHNYAHGFTLFWYTGDEATQSSKRNVIVNNTVYFRPGEGRFSLLMRRSATGCTVKNNIFAGGSRGAMYIEPSCLEGLDIDRNVVFNHRGQRLIGDASEGAGEGVSSVDGDERKGQWGRLGFEPDTSDGLDILLDAWRAHGLSPDSLFGEMPKFADEAGGDFRLTDGSVGIDDGESITDLAPFDIEGAPRPQGEGFDCGCYEMRAE